MADAYCIFAVHITKGYLMAKSSENNQNLSAVIRAEVNPSLKAAYETWWRSNGFASEADAVRWYVRNITGWTPENQANSEKKQE